MGHEIDERRGLGTERTARRGGARAGRLTGVRNDIRSTAHSLTTASPAFAGLGLVGEGIAFVHAELADPPRPPGYSGAAAPSRRTPGGRWASAASGGGRIDPA